jgi:hypothetical protein
MTKSKSVSVIREGQTVNFNNFGVFFTKNMRLYEKFFYLRGGQGPCWSPAVSATALNCLRLLALPPFFYSCYCSSIPHPYSRHDGKGEQAYFF